jgi:hypothetical protein
MKKLSINLFTMMLFMIAVFIVVAQDSCKKSDTGGSPVITGFRLYKAQGLDSVISKDSAINAIRPGDYIVIQGRNLENVQSVYFDGFPATFNPTFSTKTNFVVQVPTTIPFANIPANLFNTVKVTTGSGSYTLNFPIAAPKPVISSISDEMPNPGDKMTIYGNGLFAISALTLPGNISVDPKSITSDPGGTFSTFVLPAGFTNQTGPITLTTKYGAGTSVGILNDRADIVCDFDTKNIIDASNSGAVVSNDASLYPGAQGNYARMNFASMPAGDWGDGGPGRRLMLSYFQWVPVANVNDPTSNWAVKFEVYVKNPWIGGCLFLQDWSWNHTCRYEPFLTTGSYQTTGWVTVTMPLSSFKSKPSTGPTAGIDGTGDAFPTVAGLIGATGNDRLGFFLDNSLVPVTNFDIAIDNIRIVKIAK